MQEIFTATVEFRVLLRLSKGTFSAKRQNFNKNQVVLKPSLTGSKNSYNHKFLIAVDISIALILFYFAAYLSYAQ